MTRAQSAEVWCSMGRAGSNADQRSSWLGSPSVSAVRVLRRDELQASRVHEAGRIVGFLNRA